MIEHIRANKGKEFLYVLPVKPYPYNKIETYIICKVKVLNIHNTCSECEIVEVISENPKFPCFSYYKKLGYKYKCSNKYLFNITNK